MNYFGKEAGGEMYSAANVGSFAQKDRVIQGEKPNSGDGRSNSWGNNC